MSRSVLVVDDSPYVGDVLVSALEREGCRAAVARNRHQALHLSRSEKPDLITVEVGPEFDCGFVSDLIADLAEAAVIVIAPSKRTVPPAICARALRVFEKPFYLAEVVATAVEALSRLPTKVQPAG